MVHHDEVGFILEMQAYFNIQKSVSVAPYSQPRKKNDHFNRLKKKKAFHKTKHPDFKHCQFKKWNSPAKEEDIGNSSTW